MNKITLLCVLLMVACSRNDEGIIMWRGQTYLGNGITTDIVIKDMKPEHKLRIEVEDNHIGNIVVTRSSDLVEIAMLENIVVLQIGYADENCGVYLIDTRSRLIKKMSCGVLTNIKNLVGIEVSTFYKVEKNNMEYKCLVSKNNLELLSCKSRDLNKLTAKGKIDLKWLEYKP